MKKKVAYIDLFFFIFSILTLQGCQRSRIEHESHAWTLFRMLSRQACKISCIKENITFFACHFFLKLKPIHSLMDADVKRTAKYENIIIYLFFLVPLSSRQAILKSW